MGKILDLDTIREAAANLDRIAAEHPELLGKSTPEDWERTLSELQAMRKTAKPGKDRQKELRDRRLSQGLIRPDVWVSPKDIQSLREKFPGPRNGVSWGDVISAALAFQEQQQDRESAP